MFVLVLSPAVSNADPVFSVWVGTHMAIMVHDVVTTGTTLPTCDKAKLENPSAYALTHGGWGSGNINRPNLKTCKEN